MEGFFLFRIISYIIRLRCNIQATPDLVHMPTTRREFFSNDGKYFSSVYDNGSIIPVLAVLYPHNEWAIISTYA
ncbi:hypothetical protein MACH08_29070 [Oceanobacillus kimchii]|uniref:Uncharacterized protein n=1 Tax=Oceanobacillus kimchii TaxID=746691 RepID=A0ABQ5TND3_9BACI|nr:hypothetical protein MACH08_29070 [Oceanobacillus kimchii]